MDMLQIIVLALIQGLTEFLPISSSAHLLLPSKVLGWSDQGLAFDIAVHAGTLLAVLIYYRDSLRALVSGALGGHSPVRSAGVERVVSPESIESIESIQSAGNGVALDHAANNAWQEIGCLAVATIPVLLVGALLSSFIDSHLRGVETVAYATLGFGLLLGVAYRTRGPGIDEQPITRIDHALIIGCAQVLALIPGTSRSGITITAAAFLGYNIASSARFSFLLSIPVISGALVLMLLTNSAPLLSDAAFEIVTAMLIAGLSAYATIAFFVALVQRVGMLPFVVYRVLLAGVLLTII